MVYTHPRNLGDLQIRDCHPTPPPHPNIRMCKCMCLVAQVSLSGNVSQALAYVRQKLVAYVRRSPLPTLSKDPDTVSVSLSYKTAFPHYIPIIPTRFQGGITDSSDNQVDGFQ